MSHSSSAREELRQGGVRGASLRAFLWTACFAVAATGCSSCTRGLPRGGLIQDPARITTVLTERASRVRALRAHGSADQFGRNGRVRGEVAIRVRAPDKVRFDMFAFGQLVSSLVTNGSQFGLLQGQQYLVGPARACAAQQIAGIPLEAREIAAVLSGGVPVIGAPVGPVRWEEGHYVLDLRSTEGNTARIELELPSDQDALAPSRQSPRVTRVVLRDGRGPRADIRYEGYRLVEGEAFPERVRVLMERDDVDMQVRFDRIELGEPPAPTQPVDDPLADENPAPAQDPFAIGAPAGATLVPVDC
ncbi:MAG: hypothetical protein U0269_29160 [Polyangiales bacterium]